MSNQDTQATASVSWTGGTSGVVAPQALDDDWSPTRDAKATDSTTAIDGTLHLAAELARRLTGAHQAAASLIIRGNWQGMRKYFSLSPKYAAWYHYRTPAVGFGIHAEVVAHNKERKRRTWQHRLRPVAVRGQPHRRALGHRHRSSPGCRRYLP